MKCRVKLKPLLAFVPVAVLSAAPAVAAGDLFYIQNHVMTIEAGDGR